MRVYLRGSEIYANDFDTPDEFQYTANGEPKLIYGGAGSSSLLGGNLLFMVQDAGQSSRFGQGVYRELSRGALYSQSAWQTRVEDVFGKLFSFQSNDTGLGELGVGQIYMLFFSSGSGTTQLGRSDTQAATEVVPAAAVLYENDFIRLEDYRIDESGRHLLY